MVMIPQMYKKQNVATLDIITNTPSATTYCKATTKQITNTDKNKALAGTCLLVKISRIPGA